MKKSRIPLLVTLAVMVFLYLPIFLMVANSFNSARYGSKWQGFSLRWYERLAERQDIIVALGTSLKIAAISSVASMVLGTAAALAHEFINFISGPEVSAENMESIAYRSPNSAAYSHLTEDFRGSELLFPPDELFAKCEPIGDLADKLPLWTKEWDRVKNA